MMSQYDAPLNWRFFRGFSDVIREYPEHPEGQRKWDERTFHPNLSGEVVPLSELWPNGPPDFLKRIFEIAIVGSSAPAHWAIRTLLSTEQSELLLRLHDFAPSQIELHEDQPMRRKSDQLLSGGD
jgi:hypothetical protein